MSASRTPDPARSRALIIGASEYDEAGRYDSLPTAAASAEKLGALIQTDKMWALPRENVTVMPYRVGVRDAAMAINEVTSHPDIDGLFVYICAHGRVFHDEHVPDHNLHLAFADSDEEWSYTHLPFLTVKRMLTRRSKAENTVLVLDSCFAAGAFLGSDAVPAPAVPGVCTLISTKRLVPAHARTADSPYTAFSSALIDIIENGISGPAEYLTVNAIFGDLRRRLQAAHPEPDMRANGASVFLCRNQAYQQVPNPLSEDELMTMLSGPDDIDPAVYATAVEDAHDGRPLTALRIVDAFGQERNASETTELAKALRSRGMPGLSGYADRLFKRVYACRPGREIADVLHWHHGEDIGVDTVLKSLLNQPDQVTADVSARLRAMECADCAGISRRFDEQIQVVWPRDRVVGLLNALY